MIHVLALIQVAPGRRDQFLQDFRPLVPAVLAEVGCIEYGPAIDFESGLGIQQMLGGDAVMVVEKWESMAALQGHLTAPHMVAWREKSAAYVKGISVQVLQPA